MATRGATLAVVVAGFAPGTARSDPPPLSEFVVQIEQVTVEGGRVTVRDCGVGLALNAHAVLSARHVLVNRVEGATHFRLRFRMNDSGVRVPFPEVGNLRTARVLPPEGERSQIATWDLAVLVMPPDIALPVPPGEALPFLALVERDLALETSEAFLHTKRLALSEAAEGQCPSGDRVPPGSTSHPTRFGTAELAMGSTGVSEKVKLTMPETPGYSGSPLTLATDDAVLGVYTGSALDDSGHKVGRASLLLDDPELRMLLASPVVGARVRPLYARWRPRSRLGLGLRGVGLLVPSGDGEPELPPSPTLEGGGVAWRRELPLWLEAEHRSGLGFVLAAHYAQARHVSEFQGPDGQSLESTDSLRSWALSLEVGAGLVVRRHESVSGGLEVSGRADLGGLDTPGATRGFFQAGGPVLRPFVRLTPWDRPTSVLLGVPATLMWSNVPTFRYTGQGADVTEVERSPWRFTLGLDLTVEYDLAGD